MNALAFAVEDRIPASTLRIPPAAPATSVSGEAATGGELALSFPGARSCSTADRDAVLLKLHEERRSLEARRREGSLPASEADYLRDIEREIDRLELAEEAERTENHPVWPKVEELLERVLGLQSEYAEGTSQDLP
jgi:hypothetical protein